MDIHESWNSSTLATSCEELTHWKRLWCWNGLGAGGEGDNRGWDGWMASLTRWTWVWVNSGSWWWTGRPGVLRFMGLQRVGHDWAIELNWTELNHCRPSASACWRKLHGAIDNGCLECNSEQLSFCSNNNIRERAVEFQHLLPMFNAGLSGSWLSSRLRKCVWVSG